MAVAAWCKVCGRYVWLNDQWACEAGHGWDQMSRWYDPDTGTPVTPYWLQQQPSTAEEPPAAVDAAVAAPPAPAPASAEPAPAVAEPAPAEPAPAAPAPAMAEEPATPSAEMVAPPPAGSREALLAEIMAAFQQDAGYRVRYGTESDILIDNVVADASWGTGAKKVEYEAQLKADESDRTVYFWELLKEKGGGLSFGGLQAESYSTFGTKRSGKTKEIVLGPGGKAMDYTWDYGATRHRIEEIAKQAGWRLKVVLRKKSAQW